MSKENDYEVELTILLPVKFTANVTIHNEDGVRPAPTKVLKDWLKTGRTNHPQGKVIFLGVSEVEFVDAITVDDMKSADMFEALEEMVEGCALKVVKTKFKATDTR